MRLRLLRFRAPSRGRRNAPDDIEKTMGLVHLSLRGIRHFGSLLHFFVVYSQHYKPSFGSMFIFGGVWMRDEKKNQYFLLAPATVRVCEHVSVCVRRIHCVTLNFCCYTQARRHCAQMLVETFNVWHNWSHVSATRPTHAQHFHDSANEWLVRKIIFADVQCFELARATAA